MIFCCCKNTSWNSDFLANFLLKIGSKVLFNIYQWYKLVSLKLSIVLYLRFETADCTIVHGTIIVFSCTYGSLGGHGPIIRKKTIRDFRDFSWKTLCFDYLLRSIICCFMVTNRKTRKTPNKSKKIPKLGVFDPKTGIF